MKKINLLLLAVLFIAVQGCKKDDSNDPDDNGGGNGNQTEEIAKEQKTVGFYFSGNWCGPCGLYGKPTLKSMKSEFGDKFVVIASQLNSQGAQDPMNSLAASQLAGTFGASSVPTLFTGGGATTITSVSGGTGMESTARNNINAVLDASVIANTKATATANGTELKVDTKTKFFVDQSQTYRLGVYLLEDGLAFPQYVSTKGWDNAHVHYDVVRANISKATGDDLTTGATADQEVEMSFTGTLESNWKKENLKVAVVIWRVNADNKITIVNGTLAEVK